MWDDDNQAPVNYQFYVNFFKAYPELAQNEFWAGKLQNVGLVRMPVVFEPCGKLCFSKRLYNITGMYTVTRRFCSAKIGSDCVPNISE